METGTPAQGTTLIGTILSQSEQVITKKSSTCQLRGTNTLKRNKAIGTNVPILKRNGKL